jgi:hypothetical protein
VARTVDELEDGLSLLEFAALEFVPALEFSVEMLKSGLLLESEPQATRHALKKAATDIFNKKGASLFLFFI